ncbi:peptidase inhibitor family I36 protein [Streptomyces sp. NBC_01538]|uniref:peptidase inhibitor family I36 protein n=1 Tax=Streptomyces sp. NBC_01538 TaxID=2903897 RepID=UPI003863E2E7
MTYKRLLQRLAVPAAMATVMAGGGLAAAPAASAAASDCPDHYVCIFQNVDYGGRWIGNLEGHNRPNVGDYMNDRASSIINNTNYSITFYEHANYGGASFTVGQRLQVRSLGNWNDSISSWRNPCGWHPTLCG